MALIRQCFPWKFDPAAGYASEQERIFLDLEVTDKFFSLGVDTDGPNEFYEGAGLFLALAYSDAEKGLKGVNYITKLMLKEPALVDYLTKSKFGQAYHVRGSGFFQPYTLQDAVEAEIAGSTAEKDFVHDMTKSLLEDVRDEGKKAK